MEQITSSKHLKSYLTTQHCSLHTNIFHCLSCCICFANENYILKNKHWGNRLLSSSTQAAGLHIWVCFCSRFRPVSSCSEFGENTWSQSGLWRCYIKSPCSPTASLRSRWSGRSRIFKHHQERDAIYWIFIWVHPPSCPIYTYLSTVLSSSPSPSPSLSICPSAGGGPRMSLVLLTHACLGGGQTLCFRKQPWGNCDWDRGCINKVE